MEVSSGGRRQRHRPWHRRRIAAVGAVIVGLCQYAALQAQAAPESRQAPGTRIQQNPSPENESDLSSQKQADAELQTGTVLTRKGNFREAIPHLLAARAQGANEYAASFNLALCYVATSEFGLAIKVLNELRGTGHDLVDVENLLAQAYIGNSQPEKALASVQKAATLSPQNEKLYVFVADACMDHRDYRLGLEVTDIGLKNLPRSARLHYERAMFLSQLDQFDQGKPDFELVGTLAPGSEIGYMAAAQKGLFEGDILGAIRSAREGVKQGYENPALLTVLGEALIRSGVTPDQVEFAEAQAALEKAITQRPNDPASQIALGTLCLIAGRLDDAIVHLEIARQLVPGKSSVYAALARAYQRRGNQQRAQEALAILERLNREQADRIRSAPGDRKMGYASRGTSQEETVQQHP